VAVLADKEQTQRQLTTLSVGHGAEPMVQSTPSIC
jgi:hypothetical protein